MNLKQTKVALITGSCMAFLLGGAPQAWAADSTAPIQAAQQTGRITGVVTDSTGEPIIGASVMVKGAATGVTTDLDGRFAINAKPGEELVISFIGMEPKTVKVGNSTTINVELADNAQLLDEVVAVGYGTMKKSSITGSIVQMDSKSLAEMPTNNVSNMLAGKLPGLVVKQSSGIPGEGSSILVRGSNTTGTNTPIYIVDGVQRSMIDELNPDEIESISVLKDASSAAVYGVQGGAGVILINTKRGNSGKAQVRFNANLSWSQNADFPEFLNASDYMTWHNRARELDGLTPLYTDEIREMVMNGTGGYGQTNWFDELFSGKGFNQAYNLSVSGGSDRTKYFIAGSFLGMDGIVKNVDYRKFTLRSNIDTKLSDHLTLSVNMAGYQTKSYRPANDIDNGSSGSTTSVFWQTTLAKPIYPVMYGDQYSVPTTLKGNYNPIAALNESGYNNGTNNVFNSSARLTFEVPWVQGLKISAFAAYDNISYRSKLWKNPYTLGKATLGTDAVSTVNNSVQQRSVLLEGRSSSEKIAFQPSIEYENTFGKNSVRAQVVYDFLQTKSNSLSAGKMNFDLTDIHELAFGSDTEIVAGSVTGSSSKFAREGVMTRLNYSFDNKYYVEGVLRADASVRFAKDNRWGYFPAVSLGWRISEENFMENTRSWLNNLKLRASVGLTGNDQISSWQYLRSISLVKSGYVFDGVLQSYLTTGSVPYYDITWEKTRTWNGGFEATLFNSRLTAEFDYFYQYTWDILQSVSGSVPPSVGGNVPSVMNSGKVDNRGFELTLGSKGSICKDFNYSVSANVAYNHNRILQLEESVNIPDHQKRAGHRINSIVGLIAEGLYTDEDDLANSPKYAGDAQVGDIKYRDLNGDGKIDLTNDATIISDGYSPKWNYGLNLNLNYKWFDLSALFQGAAGFEVALQGTYDSGNQSTTNFTKPFAADGNTPYFLVENSWTPENPNAEFPRLTTRTAINQNAVTSTFWLRKGDYLRLKNLQIGATIPKYLLGKSGLESIRVYVGATNLFTCSALSKYGLDPEAPSVSNGYYPQQRTYTVGLTINL